MCHFPCRLAQLLKTYIETDVNRRREYVKTFATGNDTNRIHRERTLIFMLISVERAMSQLPHILPDYMLVFAVPVLTHDPEFTNHEDKAQLKAVEKCLWLILEPLITNKEFFCSGFYKNIVDRMKNHKDAFMADDDSTNHVSHLEIEIELPLIIASSFFRFSAENVGNLRHCHELNKPTSHRL